MPICAALFGDGIEKLFLFQVLKCIVRCNVARRRRAGWGVTLSLTPSRVPRAGGFHFYHHVIIVSTPLQSAFSLDVKRLLSGGDMTRVRHDAMAHDHELASSELPSAASYLASLPCYPYIDAMFVSHTQRDTPTTPTHLRNSPDGIELA
jgi:hypothetical protein